MIISKKLFREKMISHGFLNKNGGKSKGIYKSLNCGPGSKDKKKLESNKILRLQKIKFVKLQKIFFYYTRLIAINLFF